MAVAVGGNIHGQVDMEAGTVLAHGLGVFCHLAVQFVAGIPFIVADGIEGAGANKKASVRFDAAGVKMLMLKFL